MHFQIDEYLGVLDTETVDQFRSLFLEASNRQIEKIAGRYERSSGFAKHLSYDDGVMATFVRKMGAELCLISLFHLFEIKLKQVIKLKENNVSDAKLGRWDDIKSYLPDSVKNTADFSFVNKVRVLVNCFKHSGIVSHDLYKIDKSFGEEGREIEYLDIDFYSKAKMAAKNVIESAAQ